jgi:hypothetical protein
LLSATRDSAVLVGHELEIIADGHLAEDGLAVRVLAVDHVESAVEPTG